MLKEDAKKLLTNIVGAEIAKLVNDFDNPENYPESFLDDCVYFLGKIVGEEIAKRRFEHLYKKYAKAEKSAKKSGK